MYKLAYWQFSETDQNTSRDTILAAIENTLQLCVRGCVYSGTDSKRDRQTGGHAAPTNVSEKESR